MPDLNDPPRELASTYLKFAGFWPAGPKLQRALLDFTSRQPVLSTGAAAWMKSFARAFVPMSHNLFRGLNAAAMFAQSLPANLREVGSDLKIMEIIEIGREEGIGLYGAPRASLVRRLQNAPDVAARRRLLGTEARNIFDDCDAVLEQTTPPKLGFAVVMVRDAIAAARDGHWISAQAGATAALDGAARTVLADKRIREAVTRTGRITRRDETVFDEFKVIQAIALMPVYGAHPNYRYDDIVPSNYSRHATAHSAARRQFSKRNTVQAILVTTSLLAWVDDL
ncbi:hypothetical protein [Luteimicrobium subarcticum]|uniref:Uncharacterized protein n=1 Tax=Luteimicrobium subarcticum TaxID=620910 RepID=A0A2M8W3M1_9MICO|nr:hypothetical protein [Luteimicrobium subarcticum]PJI85533.1 hypothetical protein CLV34_2713 [Luteimicrobium subarcticum]